MKRIFRPTKPWLTILFVFFLAACGSTGAEFATGPTFNLGEAGPNKALVYHYRTNSTYGYALSSYVLSNGIPMARIARGGYFKESVKPGHIEYRQKMRTALVPFMYLGAIIGNALAEYEPVYSLDAKPGQVYFLRWEYSMFVGIVSKEVPSAVGIEEISGLKSFPPAVEVAPKE